LFFTNWKLTRFEHSEYRKIIVAYFVAVLHLATEWNLVWDQCSWSWIGWPADFHCTSPLVHHDVSEWEINLCWFCWVWPWCLTLKDGPDRPSNCNTLELNALILEKYGLRGRLVGSSFSLLVLVLFLHFRMDVPGAGDVS
jgi:hypothetical protein